jgi:PKHD-type hydroxylase
MKKKQNLVNPAWAFELDPIHQWAYWEKAFTKEECEKIIDIGNSYSLRTAVTRDENLNDSTKVRKSEICWLYPCDDTRWIYLRVADIVMNLNQNFFRFDLFGPIEGFQFTKYSSPGGEYGRHTDSSYGGVIRKLSFTLQLSDPEDYEGGDLNLHIGPEATVMKKEQGYCIVFPSYTLHEVTPVTKGTRYSLVCWITGKPFK